MKAQLILTTYSSPKEARTQCQEMVKMRYAACGSIFPVKSIYRWKDGLEEADETLVIFKTTPQAASKLRKHLLGKHPYQVAEILEVNAFSSNPKYSRWLNESTYGKSEERHNSLKS
jgi:periplasmic divalent cation tolerance protein